MRQFYKINIVAITVVALLLIGQGDSNEIKI